MFIKTLYNNKENLMKSNKIQAVLLLTILSLIWGSSFILIKKGLIAFSPLQLGSLRIFISGLVFLPYVIIKMGKIDLTKLKIIIIFALLESGHPVYAIITIFVSILTLAYYLKLQRK